MQFLKKNLILLIISTVLLSFSTNQPEKKYPVEATVQDWNLAVACILSPDDVSPNQKKYIANLIVTQVNTQLPKDTTKKK